MAWIDDHRIVFIFKTAMESLNRGDEASAQFYLRQLPPEQMDYVWSLVAAATGRPIESLRKPWWKRHFKLLFGVALLAAIILYFIL
jgi:hypothetical protein